MSDISISIRSALPSEASALCALAQQTYVAAFGHTFLPDDLSAHLEKNLTLQHWRQMLAEDVVLLACMANALIGYVQFGSTKLVPHAVGKCDLRRLYVQPEFQNRGIGTLLLAAALSHPMLAAAEAIYLEVYADNAGAQRLYGRHGFGVIGSRQFTVASGAPTGLELLMVRNRS